MNKHALVTGASGEIGSAIAKKLAEYGYSILVGCHKNTANAKMLCTQLCTPSYPIEIDLSDTSGISRAVSECQRITAAPDIIVNCAGCEYIGLFQDMTDEELIRVINTDLVGTMLLTKAFLPEMIKRHSGRIVNISSVWGESGASCEVAYSAAKAGLIGFTKALAKELAPSGILVNCVSPGFIDTRMNSRFTADERQSLLDDIPCCRAGLPQDVAEAVAFLASKKADYICGQTIRIDGGWI